MTFIRYRTYGNGNRKASDEPANGFAGQESAWHSDKGMPQSITYKLKNNAAICKITFYPRRWEKTSGEDCPKNFKIEGSYDGSIFYLIKNVENGKKKISGMVIIGYRPMSYYSF